MNLVPGILRSASQFWRRSVPRPAAAASVLALLVSSALAQAPPIRFATLGGEAWTFSKLLNGDYAPHRCDEVWVEGPAGRVRAVLDDGRFYAALPLRAGANAVAAECVQQGNGAARTGAVRWQVMPRDGPTAWIRVLVGTDAVVLDAGRSAPAPATPVPILRRLWTERSGNPTPLVTAAGQPLERAVRGERIELAVPDADGEYFVELEIVDAVGRRDRAAAVFRVERGRARAVDLRDEHPRWVDRAVLYGIAPHFYGDDELAGVTARLDEIAELGATAVWLSPLTEAPADDFGYAVVDHFDLRDRFGEENELRALVERAHALGLKVVLDFVPNHVSERHPFHRSVLQHGARSPYFDWFERGPGGAITSYFDWTNLKNLDYDNPEVQAYVIAAFAHWLREYGVDGFRVDASWAVRQRAPEFWPRWREALKRIEPDLFLLAEASVRDGHYVRSGFDAAYDWTDQLGDWAWTGAFADGRADLDLLRAALTNNGAGFPADTLALRFLNNNDTGRRFVARHGVGLTGAAAALTFTVPGIPLVYNGDEVGAQFEPYDEGPPLEWRDPHGLTAYYRRLAGLRRTVPALASRRLDLVATDRDRRVLAFLRAKASTEPVLVAINFTSRPQRMRLRGRELPPAFDGPLEDLLGAGRVSFDRDESVLELDAYQAVVLRPRASADVRRRPPAVPRESRTVSRDR